MNRLEALFSRKKNNILSVYFTAGYPQLNDTHLLIEYLSSAGADIVEIGMPFSDPVADGPVIQNSSLKALHNGMSVKVLFDQIKDIRKRTEIPIVLMGYLNPVLQYGIEKFCATCQATGVDGLILPDLPPEIFINQYKNIFEENKLSNILLVPPQTSDERIRYLDAMSSGFLYIVSASSTTGAKSGFQPYQINYFERIRKLKLKKPQLLGFGISDKQTFAEACSYFNGAIVGSAFIKALENQKDLKESVIEFVGKIKG
jgi:tryptophan synthase alpha chain